MSFQAYIEELQKKPVRDRKLIALVVTTILFALVIFFLFEIGGFKISTRPVDDSVKNSINDLSSSTATFWNNTSDQLNTFSYSSKAISDQLQNLASSTTSSTTGEVVATSTVTDTSNF